MGIFDDFNCRTTAPSIIKSAFSNVSFPVAVLEGFDLTLTFANQAIFDIFGKDKSFLGKPLLHIIPHLEFQSFHHLLRQVLITGNIHSEKEFAAHIFKNGKDEIIYFDYSCSPLPGDDDTITGILVVANDVTEKVMAKRKFDESEKRLVHLLTENSKPIELSGTNEGADDIKSHHERQSILSAIVESSDDTILSKTLEGIITSWNPAAQRMFGYTEDEIIGKHISILIPDRLLDEEGIIINNIKKGIKIHHFETVRVRKDGSEINISLTVSPIRDNLGKIIGASKIARDITEQKQVQLQLKNYAHTLEIINQLCCDISEELDIQKILKKVSDSATDVVGAEFGAFFYNNLNSEGEEFVFHTLSGAISDLDTLPMPADTVLFHSTLKNKEVIRVDDVTIDSRYANNTHHYSTPNGQLPVRSYLAVPVISKTGNVMGALFLGHIEAGMFTLDHENIVAAMMSQAAVALDNARLFEEVKILNTKKDEFIGMASHELKTPLTSMTGYLQILERAQKEEKQKAFVQKTVSQVKKLSALVNDILDVSKIEAGKLQFTYDSFDISELIVDCVELIQLSSGKHRILIPPELPAILIQGDKNRIEQLIINLLTNAIKYSPKATKIDLLINASGDNVQVGVRDYGIGIEADKIPQLFTRFYRVAGLNPGMSGLGIGLYISKEIVERHYGKIWVDSEKGKGSTFWFTLPKGNLFRQNA